MSFLTVHAHKGGQGVTTIAAALATIHAATGRKTLLIDTSSDLPAMLGITEPAGPGLGEYLNNTRITLGDITTPVMERLDLIALGAIQVVFDADGYGLITGGLDGYDSVIIDTTPAAHEWNRHVDQSILVTRPCYLAIRRALCHDRPTEIVLIDEPARSLTAADIETCLGLPVTATVAFDPTIARAVDTGLLTSRLPRNLARALRPLIATSDTRR